MKGISEVITVVLLLLIVVVITGFSFSFFQSVTETAKNATETQFGHQTRAMGIMYSIESIDKNKVFIRNRGTREIKDDELDFYVGGKAINFTGPASLSLNQVGKYTLNDSQLSQIDAKNIRVASAVFSQEEQVDLYGQYTIGYWKFDEGRSRIEYDGSGNPIIKDSSGNGNDGVFYGETFNSGTLKPSCPNCPKQVDGKFGKALQFDGVDDYVNAGNNENLSIIGDVTIESWIYPYDISGNSDIVRWDQLTPYGIMISNGRILFDLYDSNTGTWLNPKTDNSYVKINQWQHVAVVRNGVEYKFYYNGKNVENKIHTASPSSGNNFVIIGAAAGGFVQHFTGTIDEVRIYNYALTEQEIQQDMNSEYPINRTVAWYSFEDVNNGVAKDTHIWVKGKNGGALSFDGVDDYVDVGNASSLNLPNTITIDSWVYSKSSQPSHSGIFVGRNPIGNSKEDYALVITNNEIGFNYNNGSFWYDEINGTIPIGEWTYVLVSRNDGGGKITYFKNGNLLGTRTGIGLGGGYDGNHKVIGADRAYVPPGYFNGTLDEVRVMNIARPIG